jgi:hypothetical protein
MLVKTWKNGATELVFMRHFYLRYVVSRDDIVVATDYL